MTTNWCFDQEFQNSLSKPLPVLHLQSLLIHHDGLAKLWNACAPKNKQNVCCHVATLLRWYITAKLTEVRLHRAVGI